MIRQSIFGFKLEKTEEELTAQGGLSLLAEYNHGMGLKKLVDLHLPVAGSNRGYSPSVFADTLVLMLQGGGRSLEDTRELNRESSLLGLLGRKDIPDPDTMGDWLRRMGDPATGGKGLAGLGVVRDEINRRILRRDGIEEYTLDADATFVAGEKRDAHWSYLKEKGYMPMLGFLFEPGICLHEEFREGNEAPAAGQTPFYEACKKRMPKGKRVGSYRADSASYQSDLINVLENDKVWWAITARQDASVKALIADIPEAAWHEPERGCGFEVAETVHAMNGTKSSFRLIVKREMRRQGELFEGIAGYFYHAVASNWPEEKKNSPEVLAWHNQRGQAENFNKELKSGFGMEHMPCGQTWANAVWFRIGVIAYNLFIGFKRLACPESWGRHTIATFRWRLIQMAGRIVRHAGRVVLKLAVSAEKLALMQNIRQRSLDLSLAT